MMKQANKPHTMHRRTQPQREGDAPSLFAKHIGKSFLITAGTALLLILVAALALYFSDDPNRLILPVSLLVSALTALIGGFTSARLHGHSALICGLASGSLCTAAMMLVSLFFKPHATGYSSGLSALLHLGFMLLSVAGAYLGLRRTPKKKKKLH